MNKIEIVVNGKIVFSGTCPKPVMQEVVLMAGEAIKYASELGEAGEQSMAVVLYDWASTWRRVIKKMKGEG